MLVSRDSGAVPFGRPAKKLILPKLVLTEVTKKNDTDSYLVSDASEPYPVRPLYKEEEGKRRDGKPVWVKHQFNLFPIVVDKDGVPWAEAVIFILHKIEEKLSPNMMTFSNITDDLSAYKRFIESEKLDWMRFPKQKYARPTYRYNGHRSIQRMCINSPTMILLCFLRPSNRFLPSG